MKSETDKAVKLLTQLISTPSLSREEDKTAEILQAFLRAEGIIATRIGNNVLATHQGDDPSHPYIMLCSHHDTVKPNAAYTRDPFSADIVSDKLFGLGSNDAGASLVCLITTFVHFVKSNAKVNLILAAVAEEEVSGKNGVISILDNLPPIELAIVGEPTKMEIALAEKGLVVIDGKFEGIPGHAAHENTRNPILQVCKDIDSITRYTFDRISPLLGKTKATVSVIHAGELHNQVPATCNFVIDVRVNELYTLAEIVDILQARVQSVLTPRSLRLNPSGVPKDHKIRRVAQNLGIATFGSATLSDQALIPFPSIKMGPGDSLRSHTADEFILLEEIELGIKHYISLLQAYIITE